MPDFSSRWVWVTQSQLMQDAGALAAALPDDLAAVVGIPRSGMPVAAWIAMVRHVPLYALSRSGQVNLSVGSRSARLEVSPTGTVVLVDDTVYGGSAMNRALATLGRFWDKHRIVTAAVYVRPEALHTVDYAARRLPDPHLLEWCLLNSTQLAGASFSPYLRHGVATDYDGVIVHDEETASQWGARPGSPYLPARSARLRAIITGRHVAGMQALLRQLSRLRIQTSEVWMRSLLDQPPAAFKVERLLNLRRRGLVSAYIESSDEQAQYINAQTGLLTICTVSRRVYPPREGG